MTQQPWLDVLNAKGFGQQRVIAQVNHPHSQVIGGPPPGIDPLQLLLVVKAGELSLVRGHGRNGHDL
jgi:hypothetical protein